MKKRFVTCHSKPQMLEHLVLITAWWESCLNQWLICTVRYGALA